MAKKNAAAKLLDARIQGIFERINYGVQIPMMEIENFFIIGRKVINEGGDDEAVAAKMQEHLAKVRVN